MNRHQRRATPTIEARRLGSMSTAQLEADYNHYHNTLTAHHPNIGSDPAYSYDMETRVVSDAHSAAVSERQRYAQLFASSSSPSARMDRASLRYALEQRTRGSTFAEVIDPQPMEPLSMNDQTRSDETNRRALGFSHPNQKTLQQWSYGTKLTVMQLPIDGVAWLLPATQRPGGSHATPGLVLRAVRVADDMFFAVADSPSNPTYLTFRIPMLALLGFLSNAQSLEAHGLRKQPKELVIFRQDGTMLGKEPIPNNKPSDMADPTEDC